MALSKNQQEIEEFVKNFTTHISDDGLIKSKKLWSINTGGKYLEWQIVIGLISPETGDQQAVDWDMISNRLDTGEFAGFYYTVSGIEKGKSRISAKTIITEGKNVNKANRTTPLTQAIYQAMSLFDKRLKKGSTLDRKTLLTKGTMITINSLIAIKQRGSCPWRVHPMALHDFADGKNSERVIYPSFVQPKLDGTRFIVVNHPSLPKQSIKVISNGTVIVKEDPIDGYSRGRETYEGQDHILFVLAGILKKFPPGLHLDGELWKKGYGLQDISGSSRRFADSKIAEEAVRLDYFIFDCFLLEKPEMIWTDRMKYLAKIETLLPENAPIHVVKSEKVANAKELDDVYRSYLKEGYEGAVIRNATSLYEFDADKEKRSYTTLKYKPRPDNEWPVIDFAEGIKGKAVGAIKWVCTTTKSTLNRDGQSAKIEPQQFVAVPNWTDDVKYKIFTLLKKDKTYFAKNLKGKMVTIQYSILSKDLVPQQPKMLYFKDQTLEKKLMKDADDMKKD